jgi:hypothetical protein
MPSPPRPYTDEERKQLILSDRARRPPICPHDHTEMVTLAQRSLGLTSNVTLRCPTCRNELSFKRKHG